MEEVPKETIGDVHEGDEEKELKEQEEAPHVETGHEEQHRELDDDDEDE